ncbi:MAG TPA: TolC family protein [Chitinispirillaceae bacterium]|jgi:cobalt-zinc-cadmium efflux system outer membrane protein|nr:TolC family protein [Chitinispirillaceae bacterium]
MTRWFLMTIICWTISQADASTDTKDSLSFAEAREIILSGNAGLRSAKTEIDAAKAGVHQAGTFPNPDIEVSLEKFGVDEIEASVGQTFELGGKRKHRTEAAQIEVDALVNAGEIARLELEAEIIRRFIPIVTTTHKLDVLDSIIKITESTKEQIQRRVEAGGARATDLVRIEMDIEQLQLERRELLLENKQARMKFAALGSNQDLSLINVTGELNHELSIPDLKTLQSAVEKNPVITAYAIEQKKLEAERRQLRADAKPDLNISLGYLRNNEDNSNSPTLGLSMSVPLFNRNTAAQKQAELRQKASGEQRENTYRLLMAEIEEILSQLEAIDLKLNSLQSSIVPKARKVYETLQEYYSAGSASFLDLAEAQAEMLRLGLELLDILQDRAEKLTDLMQMTSIYLQIIK